MSDAVVKFHPTDKEIGRFVAQLRNARGITPEQVSEGVGLSTNTLQMIELGRHPLLARDLFFIMAALGTPLSLDLTPDASGDKTV